MQLLDGSLAGSRSLQGINSQFEAWGVRGAEIPQTPCRMRWRAVTSHVMKSQITYQHFLRRELQLRKRRNASYTMKAFARDLGLQDSKLSEILSGKKGLSVDRARRVAGALRLNARDADLFVTLVRAQHSRSVAERECAKQVLQKKEALKGAVIEAERFRTIADWEHFAILEILSMQGGSEAQALSARLGLDMARIKNALKRLKTVGLVNVDGTRWKTRESALETSDDVPSTAIREHHHQMLMKAQAALDLPVEWREFQTVMMSFKPEEINEAKQFLRDALGAFTERFGAGEAGQKLYAVGLQFFPLDKQAANKGQKS